MRPPSCYRYRSFVLRIGLSSDNQTGPDRYVRQVVRVGMNFEVTAKTVNAADLSDGKIPVCGHDEKLFDDFQNRPLLQLG